MFKPHIQKLVRLQTSENRDIKKGILLDRNERVENYNEITYRKIVRSISRFSINATPTFKIYIKIYLNSLKSAKTIST